METLKLNRQESCGTIILNRPSKCNAANRMMLLEIRQAVEDFQQEKSVRAILLTGSGTAFCAGIDLAEVDETMREEDAFARWLSDAKLYRSVLDTLLLSPKPVIAAVNGTAAGAGAGLLLASDIVLASPEARIGFPETRRGLVSGVAAPLLQFRAGGGAASYLLLTSELVSAERAQQWGLVHELVEEAKLWARGNELANSFGQAAHEAIQLTKKTVNETIGEQLSAWMASGAAASASARTTEAAAEGVSAFLGKRPPQWP